MTRNRVLSLCTALLALGAVGCAALPGTFGSKDPVLAKRFYSGAIVYTVEPEAQSLVAKTVRLQSRAVSLRDASIDTRSDELILPLYRDADMNRDHHITALEAEAFYHQYVRDFEDQLGPVVSR